MRGPKPPAIALSDVERQELDALTRRHTTPQQLALRARIVLAAADGANNGQIARQLHVSVNMVRRWRERGSFTSVADLQAKILRFIDYYNRTMAKPFKWTYQGKPLVA